MPKLKVKAMVAEGMYRRAGRAFSSVETIVEVDDAQAKTLEADPKLICVRFPESGSSGGGSSTKK